MKKVLIVVAVVVVLIAAGIFLILSNLDALVEKAIEKHGSTVTQTGVSVSGVKLSLREGRGTINGLRIENPDGYGALNAFSLDDITLDIDIESLGSDPIVIDEIRIVAPEIYVEVTTDGSTNITDLRKNVQESLGEGSEGGSGGSEGNEKRILIRKFVFDGGKIELDATALGQEKRTLQLPGITMNDIGGPGGFYPDQITAVILDRVIERVASAVAKAGVREAAEKKLDSEAKKLLDRVKD
jgi:hypothetical protein